MMRHHDVLALLWAVAFSLLFAGAAFGQDAGLDVFNEVSAEKHETLSEIRGACSQADAVIRASRELDECKPNSKGRTALKDRKSTRLNSSHSQISYAVFCLKKKKNK